jgi:hypothetical protein
MPAIVRRIRFLQGEIASWGSHNSQSNPGAVMELREMRRELDQLIRVVRASESQAKAPGAHQACLAAAEAHEATVAQTTASKEPSSPQGS